jgi:hypothetical protein
MAFEAPEGPHRIEIRELVVVLDLESTQCIHGVGLTRELSTAARLAKR